MLQQITITGKLNNNTHNSSKLLSKGLAQNNDDVVN